MIHPTLSRAIAAAFVLALVTSLAGPAFAKDGPGRAQAPMCQLDLKQRDCRAERSDRARDQRQPRADMHRLSADERRHLPAAPQGQSYRQRGTEIVKVDDATGAVVAVLGLAAVLLASH